jgi:hypothetical protein
MPLWMFSTVIPPSGTSSLEVVRTVSWIDRSRV